MAIFLGCSQTKTPTDPLPSPDMSDAEARREAEAFTNRMHRFAERDQQVMLAALLQRVYCEAFAAGFDRAAAIAKRHSR